MSRSDGCPSETTHTVRTKRPGTLTGPGLVVFDIDGTLTRSIAIDDLCYLQALGDVFGITGVEPDWSAYEHSTDPGIVAEIVRRRLGRPLAATELATFRARFVELIRTRLAADPALSPPVPGAVAATTAVVAHGAWRTAIATGGFGDSARAKLAAAGLAAVAAWPFASSDDGIARESIIAVARSRAGAIDDAAPIVYVGDGVWDYRAATRLGMRFIGIATGARATALRAAGATTVLPDLEPLAETLDAITP